MTQERREQFRLRAGSPTLTLVSSRVVWAGCGTLVTRFQPNPRKLPAEISCGVSKNFFGFASTPGFIAPVRVHRRSRPVGASCSRTARTPTATRIGQCKQLRWNGRGLFHAAATPVRGRARPACRSGVGCGSTARSNSLRAPDRGDDADRRRR